MRRGWRSRGRNWGCLLVCLGLWGSVILGLGGWVSVILCLRGWTAVILGLWGWGPIILGLRSSIVGSLCVLLWGALRRYRGG